jgi:hypothetical protein
MTALLEKALELVRYTMRTGGRGGLAPLAVVA